MKFVKTENLQKGMRIARPIYNRNGVLLYDRDTKLTKQGINSVRNFNLIGIYVLEPTEPLPPMSESDIEFERFQTMSVFGLREDMELLALNKRPANMENMVKIILNKYGRIKTKICAPQNLRSSEDYLYKHILYVSILAALMGQRLQFTEAETMDIIKAALVHEMGINNIINNSNIDQGPRDILEYESRLESNKNMPGNDERKVLQAKVLMAANVYDDMTSMKIDKEPSSEIVAIRYLLKNIEKYGDNVVAALIDSMKMLYPGICVELTNKSTGVIIMGNEDNVLRPVILGFKYNEIYNLMLDDVYSKVQIKDIMKSMDRRIHVDKAIIDEYMHRYSKIVK